ncbi:MAG: hypothetical protein ABFE07_25600 [Armatimonadia bacterium]
MTVQTDLSAKMLARADADGLPSDHELRRLATQFDEATAGFYAEPQTVPVQKFMGTWARTRRAWCAYSGESLV